MRTNITHSRPTVRPLLGSLKVLALVLVFELSHCEDGSSQQPVVVFSTSDLHSDMRGEIAQAQAQGWTGSSSPSLSVVNSADTAVNRAGGQGDPKAVVAYNSIAIGKGLTEGYEGQTSYFEVIARNMFGDGAVCTKGMFSVRAVELTAAQNEDSVQCEENINEDGHVCTRCGQANKVCFIGSQNGACQYVYTPRQPGFLKISIYLKGPLGLEPIQGSGFRVHVEDGGFFLPGMSFAGYLGLFLGGVGGAVLILAVLLLVAWQRYNRRKTPSEDDLELMRLEQLQSQLDATSHTREERAKLLAQLAQVDQHRGNHSDSDVSSDLDEDLEAHHQHHYNADGLGGWAGRIKTVASGIGSVGAAAGAAWSISKEHEKEKWDGADVHLGGPETFHDEVDELLGDSSWDAALDKDLGLHRDSHTHRE